MTADRLLRLYPRAWRERYGEEFLETVGSGALQLQQIIDIVAGAIDAWTSPSVRRQTRSGSVDRTSQGDPMATILGTICTRTTLRYTTRDALIGAGVMLATTLVMSAAGIILKARGLTLTGEMLVTNAFFVSLVLSMPFWVLKGQSWRAQLALTAIPIIILLGISYLATLI